ncbi:MAG: hypothetical protein JHD16_10285 [Solirubrobacteraceae bacterium]|nr:hypothetical protein [Solirubrobacteraceae bacterium]
MVLLSACGSDEQGTVTDAVAGTTYAPSSVCELLSVDTVAQELPGAAIDTSFPAADTCSYAADSGDVTLWVVSPTIAAERLGEGPGKDKPSAKGLYDMAMFDATANGARDVRPAPQLGERGQIAINAADDELAAIWRRGDTVFSLVYSLWDGSPDEAAAVAERLAKAVQSPS